MRPGLTRKHSPSSPSPSWKRKAGRPWILGHRGSRLRAPENTLEAFELALREGADGVELDVRLDRQGTPIVLHDPTLNRITGGEDCRAAERLSLAELSQVDLGGGARVSGLREVLDWAIRRNARLNVELKSDVGCRRRLLDATLAELDRVPDAPERVLLSSFYAPFIRAITEKRPALPLAWLLPPAPDKTHWTPGFRQLGADGMNPHYSLCTPERLDRWQRLQALILVWTVNDPEEACRLSALGVDGLIGDDPQALNVALNPPINRPNSPRK